MRCLELLFGLRKRKGKKRGRKTIKHLVETNSSADREDWDGVEDESEFFVRKEGIDRNKGENGQSKLPRPSIDCNPIQCQRQTHEQRLWKGRCKVPMKGRSLIVSCCDVRPLSWVDGMME